MSQRNENQWDDILWPLLVTDWGRRVAWGLVIALAFILITTILGTVSAWKSDANLSQAQSHINIFPDKEDVMDTILHIPQQHLFGEAHSQLRNTVLPVTSLQLRLEGVMMGLPEQFSRVIISRGSQSGKVYYIGDHVISGVIVHSIMQDGVVLDNHGRLEKLSLPRLALSFQGMPRSLPVEDIKEG